MEKYDEDIQENPFFCKLLSLFPSLYEDAPHHKWVICVPRMGSYSEPMCCDDDYQCHILQPLDISDPGSAFCTLNGKVASIDGKKISPKGEDDIEAVAIQILFEEVFYNSAGEKFRVLCIECPLQGNASEVVERELHSIAECVGFLKREISNLYQVDNLLAKSNALLKHKRNRTLDSHKKFATQLYHQVLQIACLDSQLDKNRLTDNLFNNNLHLAVETYVLHNIHPILMEDLKSFCAKEDVELNKIISNLYDIQPRDLEIKAQLCEAIPRAKVEIRKLVGHTTPLGKFGCLQRIFDCIKRHTNGQPSFKETTYTTDDVLALLVYLVLKAGIANWYAYLTYMKNFCFFMGSDTEIGEHGFHVATLEAAVQHIKSGILCKPMNTEGFSDSLQFDDNSAPLFPKETDLLSVKAFFEFVRDDKITEVEQMLQPIKTLEKTSHCHPLCSCDKCSSKQKMPLWKSCLLLCDNKGNTALHLAVGCGHERMTEILLKAGDGNINAYNSNGRTPLHLACCKGHQNIELLLLDKGADLNATDYEGNIPIHCAANNGHINCVKTLLYCNEHQIIKMDVNAVNHAGDTALHLASKWGYGGIVELLRQFDAAVNVLNKSRQTPIDCAHNTNIVTLLKRVRIKDLSPALHMRKSTKFPTPVLSRASSVSENMAKSASGDTKEVETNDSMDSAQFHHDKNSKYSNLEKQKRIEKLLKAVANNDQKLACFYLGLPNDELLDVRSDVLPQNLCHPLCQCEKCRPVQEAATTLYQHSLTSGLSINCHNEQGITPLHQAVIYGHLPLMELLIQNGAFVNVLDSKGATPLHLACKTNRRKSVECLLKNEAVVNMVDVGGNTPLHNSCNAGLTDIASLLIQNGANVNRTNCFGNTALHDATRNGNQYLVQLLLASEADWNLVNSKGETCLDLAKDPSIILLLKTQKMKRTLNKTIGEKK